MVSETGSKKFLVSALIALCIIVSNGTNNPGFFNRNHNSALKTMQVSRDRWIWEF